MATRTVGDRLVGSPQEPRVAGGAAEAFGGQLRQRYARGHRHLMLGRTEVGFEPRELSTLDDVTVKYHMWRDRDSSNQLKADAGVVSVARRNPNRER